MPSRRKHGRDAWSRRRRRPPSLYRGSPSMGGTRARRLEDEGAEDAALTTGAGAVC